MCGGVSIIRAIGLCSDLQQRLIRVLNAGMLEMSSSRKLFCCLVFSGAAVLHS